MEWIMKELTILGMIVILYTIVTIIQLLIRFTSSNPNATFYWHIGFWFDKKMRLWKKFGVVGVHLLGLYLITVIYHFIRVVAG